MITANENTKKIYTYKSRGAICAQVEIMKDGSANLFIAARGKKEIGLSPRTAFDAAKARQRLER